MGVEEGVRKLFGSIRDEVTGEWRRLHNEELLSVLLSNYNSDEEMKNKEMGEACGMHGEEERGYSVLVGKPDGKKPLGKPRGKWEDNIEMDLTAVGRACSVLMWIRVAGEWWAIVKWDGPSGSIKCGEFLE